MRCVCVCVQDAQVDEKSTSSARRVLPSHFSSLSHLPVAMWLLTPSTSPSNFEKEKFHFFFLLLLLLSEKSSPSFQIARSRFQTEGAGKREEKSGLPTSASLSAIEVVVAGKNIREI